MNETRDVRLSIEQLEALEDAAYRRIRELKRSIEKDSGVMHKALDRKCETLAVLGSARVDLEVAIAAIRRRQVENVRAAVNAGHSPERSFYEGGVE